MCFTTVNTNTLINFKLHYSQEVIWSLLPTKNCKILIISKDLCNCRWPVTPFCYCNWLTVISVNIFYVVFIFCYPSFKHKRQTVFFLRQVILRRWIVWTSCSIIILIATVTLMICFFYIFPCNLENNRCTSLNE